MCLESFSHHLIMSDHSMVKHGVVEEVLGMSNTNMILVKQKSLKNVSKQGWVRLCGGSVAGLDCSCLFAEEAKEIDIATSG